MPWYSIVCVMLSEKGCFLFRSCLLVKACFMPDLGVSYMSPDAGSGWRYFPHPVPDTRHPDG